MEIPTERYITKNRQQIVIKNNIKNCLAMQLINHLNSDQKLG